MKTWTVYSSALDWLRAALLESATDHGFMNAAQEQRAWALIRQLDALLGNVHETGDSTTDSAGELSGVATDAAGVIDLRVSDEAHEVLLSAARHARFSMLPFEIPIRIGAEADAFDALIEELERL